MAKIMTVDYDRCTGCRLCEMVCSVNKEGASDPARARIHVIKWEMEGIYVPMFCQHCEDPLCAAVCPVRAIERDEAEGRVRVDKEKCVGCRSCLSACPFGAIGWDEEKRKVIRCDLCHGDPTCVKFCATKAIQFIEAERAVLVRKRAAAERLHRALSQTSHGI
jgi:carbon-monoxide dehydrogenase iron sulfur subunit